jgi:hypothetical protein
MDQASVLRELVMFFRNISFSLALFALCAVGLCTLRNTRPGP